MQMRFYRNDEQEIPEPGIIVFGKAGAGAEALEVPRSVRVKAGRIR